MVIVQRVAPSWTHACCTSCYAPQSSTMTRPRFIGSCPTWKATVLQPSLIAPSSMRQSIIPHAMHHGMPSMKFSLRPSAQKMSPPMPLCTLSLTVISRASRQSTPMLMSLRTLSTSQGTQTPSQLSWSSATVLTPLQDKIAESGSDHLADSLPDRWYTTVCQFNQNYLANEAFHSAGARHHPMMPAPVTSFTTSAFSQNTTLWPTPVTVPTSAQPPQPPPHPSMTTCDSSYKSYPNPSSKMSVTFLAEKLN